MLDRAEGLIPPTWTLAKRLIAAGAAGALVPSFATGATEGMRNLVRWRWGGATQKVVAWLDRGTDTGDPCQARGYHGFAGQDGRVVGLVAGFAKGVK